MLVNRYSLGLPAATKYCRNCSKSVGGSSVEETVFAALTLLYFYAFISAVNIRNFQVTHFRYPHTTAVQQALAHNVLEG